ncbi:hypothetical protein [Microbispora sp. NPDC046933]
MVALAASAPFHASLRTVTFEPEPDRTPPLAVAARSLPEPAGQASRAA